jgi:soluble lytic murein transglycosylase-like protein
MVLRWVEKLVVNVDQQLNQPKKLQLFVFRGLFVFRDLFICFVWIGGICTTKVGAETLPTSVKMVEQSSRDLQKYAAELQRASVRQQVLRPKPISVSESAKTTTPVAKTGLSTPKLETPRRADFFTVPWDTISFAEKERPRENEAVESRDNPKAFKRLADDLAALHSAVTCPPLADSMRRKLIETNSRRHGLDQNLLAAVVEQESGFRTCAVSYKGALGLMQLMPATAKALGVSNPFDPQQNMDAGSRYLKSLLNRYEGNLDLALSAYNAGPTLVDKLGRVPRISETQHYVAAIKSRSGIGE